MKNADLYNGISAEKQAEYEAWLIETYGGEMPKHIEISKKKYARMSEAEKQPLNDELLTVETAWAAAMKNGVPADSKSLDPLLQRHRAWVSAMWDRPCPPEAYAGLADLHLSHPDFVSRYEALGEGFSDYHARSMKAYAARLGA